jgi:ER membrane protein complex subunit 6
LNSVLSSPILTSTQILSRIRSSTSLTLGIAAGILGLESQYGFLFYFLAQSIISLLIHFILAGGKPGLYFAGSGAPDPDSEEYVDGSSGSGSVGGRERIGAWRDIWLSSGVFEGLSGFVLGWAGVGGVIR